MQLLTTAVLLIATLAAGCAQIPQTDAEAKAAYDWSADIDAGALREQIGWSDDYDSSCLSERPIEAMVEAMNGSDWTSASALGERWLQQCPIDIRIHYYTAISLSRQALSNQANQHFRWADALMDAVAASGDGQSCATAYVTVSLSEEYDAMELFGLFNEHAAPIDDGSGCDMFAVSDEQGNKSNIYFHASAQIARYAAICKSDKPQLGFGASCQ